MNDFPNFSHYHYQIEKELGHNRAGGRVTYLATDTSHQRLVVIKQFQFAKSGSSWQSYDTYDREVQLLKELNHPGIPRYLDAFQTEDGFCMVQEYKQAVSFATSRSFNPEEIKQIAIAALEVLVYLQNRIPPVIHRDLKPENILVDEAGHVYLIDFGFARVGGGEVGVSSVVKGTLGFMPPEQLFNRQLTEASDLYGLGMSLICLLTNTKSDRIGDLVDISYRVSFKHLVPKLNMHWVNWLEKMVESRLKDRFPNAMAALAAVPPSPLRPPEAQFSQSTLDFTAGQSGALLTQTVTITNPVPETLLEGQWAVASHPHDPPSERYSWIVIEPKTFEGNQVQCRVTVDTRKLIAGKIYRRRLLLSANTLAKTYSLNIQVQTARLPMPAYFLSYGLLALLGLFFTGLSLLTSGFVLVAGTVTNSLSSATIGTLVGSALGLECAAWLMYSSGWQFGAASSTVPAVILGGIVLTQILFNAVATVVPSAILLGTGLGIVSGGLAGIAISIAVEKMLLGGSQKLAAFAVPLLIAIMGASTGLGLTVGMTNGLVLPPLMMSSLALAIYIVHLQLKQAHFSKNERFLIKP
jgi:serine/threonine protein kinase